MCCAGARVAFYPVASLMNSGLDIPSRALPPAPLLWRPQMAGTVMSEFFGDWHGAGPAGARRRDPEPGLALLGLWLGSGLDEGRTS